MADWCSMPADILYTIFLCLPSPTWIDILSFRSVCAAWRFAVNPQPLSKPHNPIISPCNINYKVWDIYLAKRTIYLLQSTTRPRVSWIIKLEQNYDKNIFKHLVHPLYESRKVPWAESNPKFLSFMNFRVKELGQEYILRTPATVRSDEKRRSVVLNDSGDGFVLLTIMYGRLAIYKSCDDKWKSIEDINSFYVDVIVSGGKFYAISLMGKLVFVDHVNMNMSIVANTSIEGRYMYLVDCDGELWLVNISSKSKIGRFSGTCHRVSREFKIDRFDENTGEWIKVRDLGDRMLFLSDHCKFFVSVSDIFGGDGGKGNRIIVNSRHDSGVEVFDLESGSIEPLFSHPDYYRLFCTTTLDYFGCVS